MKKLISKKTSLVNATHPLVGTWEQAEENPVVPTSVVYTIAAKKEQFIVSGIDEEDDVVLKISKAKWDGECLRFTTLYPPTKHKAEHILRVVGRNKMMHMVRYREEGVTYGADERWRKRLPALKSRQAK